MDKLVEISNRATQKVEGSVARGDARIVVPVNSDIKITAPPQSVSSMMREGDDLILKFADGSSIRLENYFTCPTDELGQISVDDPSTGAEFLVNLDSATCFAPGDVSSEAVTYNLTPLETAAAAPAAGAAAEGGLSTLAIAGLGALAAGGIIAASAGGGGGGSGNSGNPPKDTAPPATPSTPAASDNVGAVQGVLVAGGITDDTTPTFSGTTEARATISVYDGTTLIGTTVANASGAWTFTPDTPLGQGAHSLTFTATDTSGNVSTASAPFAFTVDTTAPAAPVVAPSDGTSVSGTAEAGAIIGVDTNGDGTADATTTAGADGTWSVTLPTPLANGSVVTIIATDAAGNASPAGTVTVDVGDVTPPAVPGVPGASDNAGAIVGPVTAGGVTDDTTPTFSGTTEAGATISIFDGTALLGTTVADGSGAWSFTPTTPLGQGPHSLTFTSTDTDGNTSAPSAPFAFSVDTTAPAAPAFGPSDGLTVAGTAEAGATIALDTNGDGTPDATTIAGPDGSWSVTLPAALANGAVVSATATDTAGNVSPAGTVTVDTGLDTTPPAVPVLTSVTDDADPVQGILASGSATNDATPILAGTAEPGVLVSIYDGTALLGTVVADGTTGAWTFAPTLADGPHSLSATTTDAAGNESQPSPAFNLTVDTAAPAAPAVAPSDGLTITGTAEAGATIGVDTDGDGLADMTTTAAPDGSWSVTLPAALANGTVVTATATDAAGNVSPAGTGTVVTGADTTPPAPPLIDPSDGTVLTGTAEPGATIDIDLNGDGVSDGIVVADATTGAWTFTPAGPIADGTTVNVTATDTAGNTSPPSAVIIDVGAPAAPVIASATDDVEGGIGVIANAGLSNDPTLALTGTAEAGSTVNVYDGAALIGTVAADAVTGAWTLTAPALAEGPHSFTATATDALGNLGPASGAYAVTIDLTPPAAPVLNATDGTTLSGTAEAGATVLIDTNGDGTADQIVTANGNGDWTATFAPALANGTAVSVIAVDAAGNASTAAPGTVTAAIDSTPPPIPVLGSVTDDVDPVQGPLTSGGSTNDVTPTLTGTAEAGVLVSIYDGTALLGTVVADGTTGAWTFTPTLADGPHSLSATTTDAAGNESQPSPAFALIVDTAPPAAPAVNPTNGTTITGTAEANAVIGIDTNGDGIPDAAATADGAGNWSVTVPALADGTLVTATATDAAGNVSAPSAPAVVDAAAPAVPAIAAVTDDVAPVQGVVANGGFTDDGLPTLSGISETGAVITVYDGTTPLGTATADGAGAWTFTPTVPLVDGLHSLTITATDALGNLSAASAAYVVNVDTEAPVLPVITAVTDNVGPVLGSVAPGGVTDDTLPALNGTAEANSTVSIYSNGALIGTALADGGGAWNFTPAAALANGSRAFVVTSTDAAGNVSGQSASYQITIDNGAPTTPAITTANDNVGVTQGGLSSGATTDDGTPTLTGTADPNATVTILQGGGPVATVTADPLGNWTYTPTLVDGTFTYTATVTNAAGITSPASAPFTLTVDTAPVAPPAIVSAADDVGIFLNPALGSGAVTDDIEPLLSGTTTPGTSVTIFDGTSMLGLAVTDAAGAWTFTPTTALAEGPHSFTAIATNAAGVASPASVAFGLTVDTTAPDAPLIFESNGTVLNGTAEANALINLDFNDNGTIDDTTTADINGNWTYTPVAGLLTDGTLVIVSATDAAGNTSGTDSITIDLTPPTALAIVSVQDDVDPQTGPVANGGATDDIAPVITGTVEPGATVTVFDTVLGVTTQIGQVTAGTNGQWTLPVTLAPGAHSFTATATDALGNTTAPTPAYAITVDTGTPSTPVITDVFDNVGITTGIVPSGGGTDDTLPTINGTGPANATISVSNGSILIGTTTTDSGGVWSLTPAAASPLADGTYNFTAIATNAAGNSSVASTPYTVELNSTVPPPATVSFADDNIAGGLQGPFLNGDLTNDNTPTLNGRAEPNSTVSVFNNGVFLANVRADGAGIWTYTPTLADGQQSITVSSLNVAGNSSPVSAPFTFTVDATAPAGPAVAPTNGTGTLTGTAEPGATVSIDIGNDGSADTVLADPTTGAWSYPIPGAPLAADTPIAVTATDAAGNTSAITLTAVDLTPPAAPILTSVTDDQGTPGLIVAGTVTDDATPTLVGTADPNVTVTVLNGATVLGTTTSDPVTGAWTLTTTPLADGPYNLTVTATDAVGNAASTPVPGFTVLATPPTAPVISLVDDNTGTALGPVGPAASTDDPTPTVSGTADANAIITLSINGIVQPGTVTATGGAWSFTPTLTGGDGLYTFIVTATNAAGTVSTPASYTITLDTVALAPVIDPSDGTTVLGDAEANSLVQLFVDGVATGAPISVDAFGHWTAAFAPPLADGVTLTATATDAAGNLSPLSTPTIVDTGFDSTPPAIPVITAVADDGVTPGPIPAGSATNDSTPLVSGTADPGVTITLYDGTAPIGTTTSDPISGAWSFTPLLPLGEGAHSISAMASENGVDSLNSPAVGFTVDTLVPATPTIAPTDGSPLNGTAEANAFVDLDFNGDGVADVTVVANGTGVWTYTPGTPLADGTVVTVTARDAAGNISPPASQTVDAAAPAVPTITTAFDDSAPVTGNVAIGGTTNDTTPTLSGTAEAGSTVTISDGATVLGTVTADVGNTWTFTSPVLAGGGHSFTVTAADALGNTSAPSAAYTITIDTSVPATPVITGANDNVGTPSGPILNNGATNDSTPDITGSGPASTTLSVFEGATLVGTTTSDINGNWTVTPTLGNGSHSLTAIATNAAGIQSAASGAFTIVVDTIAPATPVLTAVTDDVAAFTGALATGAVTNDVTPTLTGTAEANSTVSIFDNGTQIGTVTASASGAWTFTPTTPLTTGPHALTVAATDAVGNLGPATTPFNLTADTTAPVTPTITSALDDVGPILGTIPNNGVTNDATPTLSGTAESGATVSIFNNGALLGTVLANGAGIWNFTPPSPLPDGPYTFTASSLDPAGNLGGTSAAYNITVDTTPPITPTITGASDDTPPVLGPIANGGATNDTTPALTGNAEANSTVTIYEGTTLIGTTTANASGVWNFTTGALGQGNHSFNVRATDASGNQSGASASFTVRVDSVAPAAPVIASLTDDIGTIQGSIANGGVTNDTIPLLGGTAEAGTTLTLLANGVSLGTTLVDPTGTWNFSPATPLPQGTYSFTATTTDAAGNVSTPSAVFSVTVDTTPPPVPVISSIVDDAPLYVGVIASGGLTNDGAPQLVGNAAANTTVLIYDGTVLVGSTTSNGTGNWTFTGGTAVANGTHSFTAIAVDTAGNASAASNTYGLVVDSLAPTQTIAITTLTADTGTQGDWSTEDRDPTIGGTLSGPLGAGEQVQVQIDGGAWVNAATSGNTWFYGPGQLAVGSHTVAARVVDTGGNLGSSATQPLSITAIPQVAPVVQSSGTALLGLVGAEALNLIDLNSQSLTAFDRNNNLRTVTVTASSLLSLGFNALVGSTLLAAELGLTLSIANDPGFLNLGGISTVTITSATAGAAMDNLAVNELLNSIHLSTTVLGVNLLGGISISATDTTSLNSGTSSAGSLLNLNLLSANGSPNFIEGTNNNDSLLGTAGNDRLYGHGGADILYGGDGNDFLRGAAGADTLLGEGGNDTLVYDAADILIDGGIGTDTLLIQTPAATILNFDAATNVRNIEVIDLGVNDTGRQITLTQAGVSTMTDTNQTLTINGDSADSVTMAGAIFQGQSVIGGEAYNHYTLGTTNIFVDHPVMVVV